MRSGPLVLAAAVSLGVVGWSAFTGHVWPLYGLLVALTAWATRRDETLQSVGWALAVSWLISNSAHWWVSPVDRPQAYTIGEAAVLSMAFFSHVLGGSRAMIALVAVSVLSIACNFYVATFDVLTHQQTYTWELATNLLFIVENLLVLLPVAYDRARHRPGGWFNGLVRHGAPTGPAEAKR